MEKADLDGESGGVVTKGVTDEHVSMNISA